MVNEQALPYKKLHGGCSAYMEEVGSRGELYTRTTLQIRRNYLSAEHKSSTCVNHIGLSLTMYDMLLAVAAPPT